MLTKKKVLMLCTGGTISMLHKIDGDTSSPLVPAAWEQIQNNFPALKELEDRFDVVTNEMELIDSSDMFPGYWTEIAKKIRDNYEKFNGFVVLHGTDTMSYTATALSFMLENLNKPVVITGSQLPLAKPRTDAAQNLVTALMIAASDGVDLIPEVSILFDKVLLRGNRSRKVSSNGFAGFDSPNCEPLAKIGEHIEVNKKLIKKSPTAPFFVSEFLDPNVLPFDIFPGINTAILESLFDIKGLKGVIMKTYGTGNVPINSRFLDEIGNAVNKNIAVVNITQCSQGMVEMGLYDASVGLLQRGVISGLDMTPEAALVKMMFLLGQGYEIDTAKDQMQRDLRGEQSANVFNFIYKYGKTDNNVNNLQTQTIPAGFNRDKVKKANIRFEKIKIENQGKNNLNLAIFMNYPNPNAETDIGIPQCIGVMKNVSKDTDFMLDCTEKVRQVIAPGRPIQLSVVAQNGDISWGGIVLSIYTDVD
jgi:L-asparaginase